MKTFVLEREGQEGEDGIQTCLWTFLLFFWCISSHFLFSAVRRLTLCPGGLLTSPTSPFKKHATL